MAGNRAVVYQGPHTVEVQSIDYPKMETPNGRKFNHGVIVKLVSTNICGSDLHMYRGRTSAPKGTVLGHENTGEVVEIGSDVEYISVGDIVSIPFNIACGRCRNCKERFTNLCINTNPAGIGGAYGFVGMGGWLGGQAEYMMVPYADFNLLKFPDRDEAFEKIQDLTLLSDILPTGYHGAVQAGVGSGSTVYIAGAGPVGLCCAISSHFLGAAVVIVGDLNADRLALAKRMGCETIDLTKTESLPESIRAILGVPQVDCSVDCVGFEAHGLGRQSNVEAPLTNPLIEATRVPGAIGVPGLYLPEDPGAADEMRKHGFQMIDLGLAWVKGHAIAGGQCPVMRHNRELMEAILHDRIHPGRSLNVTLIPLEQAAQAYRDFDKGVARKFVFDPHAMLKSLQLAA
jgi:glutathione-independent formaldehyde dehydrogenase